MTEGALSNTTAVAGPPPRRKLRNFLLNPKFQLKYTLAVVSVTALVSGVLGYFAYNYSTAQTEQLTMSMAMNNPSLADEDAAYFENMAAAEDRKVALSILGGIGVMILLLGLTGIVITHKMAGPIYKMKRLLREVADGDLSIKPGLRKGDEFQDLSEVFSEMVLTLREQQAEEIADLDAAIEGARSAGLKGADLQGLTDLRARMQSRLK